MCHVQAKSWRQEAASQAEGEFELDLSLTGRGEQRLDPANDGRETTRKRHSGSSKGKNNDVQPSTSGATGCTGAFTPEQQAVISAIMPQLTQVIDRSVARAVRMQPHSNRQTGGEKNFDSACSKYMTAGR